MFQLSSYFSINLKMPVALNAHFIVSTYNLFFFIILKYFLYLIMEGVHCAGALQCLLKSDSSEYPEFRVKIIVQSW